LFLWGWLSRPLGARLPSGMLGLPYAFAALKYAHEITADKLSGSAIARGARAKFAYQAAIEPHASVADCAPGSLAEFAMERYSGFFCRGDERRVFRVWHPPWKQV